MAGSRTTATPFDWQRGGGDTPRTAPNTLSDATALPRVGRSLRGFVSTVPSSPAAIVLLAARLWMAEIFFRSGLLKARSFSSAQFLFAEVHPVPLLSPLAVALLATTIELVASAMFALGLLVRLAALPMLAMTLIIQSVVGAQDLSVPQKEHYYLMFICMFMITLGVGRYSLDHLLIGRRLEARR